MLRDAHVLRYSSPPLRKPSVARSSRILPGWHYGWAKPRAPGTRQLGRCLKHLNSSIQGPKRPERGPFSHAMNPSVQANKIYGHWTGIASCSCLDGQETRAKTSFDTALGSTGPRIFTCGPISSIYKMVMQVITRCNQVSALKVLLNPSLVLGLQWGPRPADGFHLASLPNPVSLAGDLASQAVERGSSWNSQRTLLILSQRHPH